MHLFDGPFRLRKERRRSGSRNLNKFKKGWLALSDYGRIGEMCTFL